MEAVLKTYQVDITLSCDVNEPVAASDLFYNFIYHFAARILPKMIERATRDAKGSGQFWRLAARHCRHVLDEGNLAPVYRT
jgi:hypothetical protein